MTMGELKPKQSAYIRSVGAVHRCIHAAVHILEPEAKKKGDAGALCRYKDGGK